MSKQKRNSNAQKLLSKRFKEALTLIELSPTSAYKALGYSTPSTLYSITAGRCLPDLLKLIELSKLQSPSGYRINIDWLITGCGEKLLSTNEERNRNNEVETLLAGYSQKKLDALITLLN